MRLRDHYDWVVLGDHPGALLSASLAARLGLSVLILPVAPGMRAQVSTSGQVLDPETNFLLGLGCIEHVNGLVSETLGKLGILPVETAQIRGAGATAPQVLTPGSRLELARDFDRLEGELGREFGAATRKGLGLVEVLKQADGEFASFWLQLPQRLSARKGRPAGARAVKGLDEVRKKLVRNQRLTRASEKAWLLPGQKISVLDPEAVSASASGFYETCVGIWQGIHGVGMGSLGGANDEPTLADIAHALALARTGASFQGGMTAYRELLLRLARRLGAHLPPQTECKRIFVSNGRFIGVQVSNRGNMIGASGGVLGCSLGSALDHVATSGRNLLKRLKNAPRPLGWRFTLALTVHEEAVPAGMSNRVVWQEAGAPSLEIEAALPSDYGVQGVPGSGQRLLFLRSSLPFHESSLKPANQKLVAARMLRRAAEILPFLEFHIIRIYPDFRKEDLMHALDGGPRSEMEQAYAFSNLDMIPENLRVYGGSGVGSGAGVDGLFLATGEAYPELGSLGPTAAAFEAVSWLAQKSGLAGPLA